MISDFFLTLVLFQRLKFLFPVNIVYPSYHLVSCHLYVATPFRNQIPGLGINS